jgi:excisionase family DNA binding protein
MDNLQENTKYLTIPETAKKLQVSEITVRRLLKKGELPACKFGRLWRIKSTDIK